MHPTMPFFEEPVIVRIGEINVTSMTVVTPAGAFPLRGSEWHVADQWTPQQRIPGWAIALAVLLFFCIAFFSLLFLLAKETTYAGTVTVTVRNGPAMYVTRMPVYSPQQTQAIYQQVNYARSLALV
jgi:hypothetical protein